jgi:myo-inositol-1(or 4)-monophosphatase
LRAIEVVQPAQIAARLAACVREAGALARSLFQTPLKNWTKDGNSPVCEADIAVNELLHKQLADAAIAWLSEESIDDPTRLDARYVWVVDPIDGTRAYIAGLPDWAVSAALVDNGRPIVACLYAPVPEEFFLAVAGAGATLNGVPIAATAETTLANTRIAGPKSLLDRVAAAAPPFTAMPRSRSLALRLARVAQGTCDIAFAGGNSHDWDLAAADLLVHEAGGALTTFAGDPLTYNRPVPRHRELVAAGRDRHAALIGLLRDKRIAPP